MLVFTSILGESKIDRGLFVLIAELFMKFVPVLEQIEFIALGEAS